jgi:hypothetical protein
MVIRKYFVWKRSVQDGFRIVSNIVRSCQRSWTVEFCSQHFILWRVHLLLDNDSVNRLQAVFYVVRARPLLFNGAVNTHKTIRDNRRRCFRWGPWKVVKKNNSIEQHREQSRVWDASLPGYELGVGLSGVFGIGSWRNDNKTSCVSWSNSEAVISPLLGCG